MKAYKVKSLDGCELYGYEAWSKLRNAVVGLNAGRDGGPVLVSVDNSYHPQQGETGQWFGIMRGDGKMLSGKQIQAVHWFFWGVMSEHPSLFYIKGEGDK